MRTHCWLCADLDSDDRCYVQMNSQELPVCRKCWEQMILSPGRILRSWRTIVFGDWVPALVPSSPVPGIDGREEESA